MLISGFGQAQPCIRSSLPPSDRRMAAPIPRSTLTTSSKVCLGRWVGIRVQPLSAASSSQSTFSIKYIATAGTPVRRWARGPSGGSPCAATTEPGHGRSRLTSGGRTCQQGVPQARLQARCADAAFHACQALPQQPSTHARPCHSSRPAADTERVTSGCLWAI